MPTHDTRTLARKLVDASDEQVVDVVRLVDAMPARGPAADALINPLRPRLARLRPSRPLNFTRVLFTPLTGAIVSGPHWKGGAFAIPRPALAPLARLVMARVGGVAAGSDQLQGLTSESDEARLIEVGSALWACAAEVLADASAPAEWRDEAGFSDSMFAPLARGIAAVLRQAALLRQLPGLGRPQQERAIQTIIAGTAEREPDAIGLLSAVLLARVPAYGAHVLAELARPQQRQAASAPRNSVDDLIERTVEELSGRLDASPHSTNVVHQAQSIAELATLLDAMESSARRPEIRLRVQQVRRDSDAACRAQFMSGLTSGLSDRFAELPADTADAVFSGLEQAARDLRHLERAGRRLGGGASYDAGLKATAATLAQSSDQKLVDRVRLAEILVGTDQALELLKC